LICDFAALSLELINSRILSKTVSRNACLKTKMKLVVTGSLQDQKKINPEVHKKDSFFRKSERPCTSVVMDQSVSWDRRKKRLRLLVFLAFELV
jgi:hypothetical protein